MTMTELEYQDEILQSREGDWLIVIDEVEARSFPDYERITLPAGTRLRVRWTNPSLDELTCYTVNGALVELKRMACSHLQPELKAGAQ